MNVYTIDLILNLFLPLVVLTFYPGFVTHEHLVTIPRTPLKDLDQQLECKLDAATLLDHQIVCMSIGLRLILQRVQKHYLL